MLSSLAHGCRPSPVTIWAGVHSPKKCPVPFTLGPVSFSNPDPGERLTPKSSSFSPGPFPAWEPSSDQISHLGRGGVNPTSNIWYIYCLELKALGKQPTKGQASLNSEDGLPGCGWRCPELGKQGHQPGRGLHCTQVLHVAIETTKI